jgi:hypothetical protein
MRVLVCAAVVLVLTGCGTTRTVTRTAFTQTTVHVTTTAAPKLVVGVVGDLVIDVPGARQQHGTLAHVAGDPLVLVDANIPAAVRLPEIATANPGSHFALVGGSATALHLPNVVGLVILQEPAAELAGVVAGIVAAGEGVQAPRVGWVGVRNTPLDRSFTMGVHAEAAQGLVLHAWTGASPAACKEAALTLIGRGAVAIVAPSGVCGDAAVAGAHEQNAVGLKLSDFTLPSIPAAEIVRDAVGGVYHGGEDFVFGAQSGAIGIGVLDPRVGSSAVLRAKTIAGRLASGQQIAG